MMCSKPAAALLAAFLCLGSCGATAQAAQVNCDEVYCFTQEDFSEGSSLSGICITGLPASSLGTVKLGERVLRPGDVLTVDQVAQMTFCPLRTTVDSQAEVTYLPIYENRVESRASMTISIRGREDKPPIAEDSAMETYKNLPNTDRLKVREPEDQTMTYTVTRQPRRGQVTLHSDGTYTYTPKKNKVGVDSFVYTASDPAGHVSREATVTVTIRKPTESTLYTDTVGKTCRFEAEWMKNTGIFEGENVAGHICFQPEKPVTRGEFITMLVKTLDIPVPEETAASLKDAPRWLQPYLTAALRSGLTEGLPQLEILDACAPITGAEAAVMLQNALDLSGGDLSAFADGEDLPVWAQSAVAALAGSGILLDETVLTRGQAAELLYRVSLLADTAPGMAIIRAQRG